MIRRGLYRHFKGRYYYVFNLSRSAEDEKTVMVSYVDVCRPESGSFTRNAEDFLSDYDLITDKEGNKKKRYIKDRLDNYTGQTYRFEKIENLNFQVSSVSTEQLLRELSMREDSPIKDLDIDGAESEKVFRRDYLVGKPMRDEVHGNYLVMANAFDDRDEAVKNVKKNYFNGARLFKRVLLKEDFTEF